MKGCILFFCFSILIACQQRSDSNVRPPAQSKFTDVVKTIRDHIDQVEDEQIKRQILRKGVDSVKQYIQDTLALKFDSWQARVLDVKDNYDYSDQIDLRLGINIDSTRMTEKSRYESVVLRDIILKPSSPLTPIILKLKIGDIVRISGTFISKNGNIDIGSYNEYKISKNLFSNPQFRVELINIEQ